MPQRLARLEEEVHGIQVSIGEQREVVDAIAKDLSRFTVWAAGGISQLLASAGAIYMRYFETHVLQLRATARTMPQRLARLEEEVHGIQVSVGEQCEVVDAIAKDLSRFTVWAAGGISQLLALAGAIYMRYFETHVPYQRRVQCRTDDATTLAP
nr:hypothetical protein [Tanacetum cinerariifolium]